MDKYTGNCYWKLLNSYHLVIKGTPDKGFTRYTGKGMITGNSNIQQLIQVVDVLEELDSEGLPIKIKLPRDCRNMFAYCCYVKKFDLHLMDSSEVVNMRAMFKHCHHAKEINLSSWSTLKVHSNVAGMTEFDEMFDNCSSLETLDLSSFDTRAFDEEASVQWMFNECENLKHIYVYGSRWVLDQVNRSENQNVFRKCKKLHNRRNDCCADDSIDKAKVDGYLDNKKFKFYKGLVAEVDGVKGLNEEYVQITKSRYDFTVPANSEGYLCLAYPTMLNELESIIDYDSISYYWKENEEWVDPHEPWWYKYILERPDDMTLEEWIAFLISLDSEGSEGSSEGNSELPWFPNPDSEDKGWWVREDTIEGDENIQLFEKKNILVNSEEYFLYHTRSRNLFLSGDLDLTIKFSEKEVN